MADITPESFGYQPAVSARPTFNAGSTAGGADVASTTEEQPLDPTALGYKLVGDAPQSNADPASLGYSLTDPKDIAAKAAADPTSLTHDEWQTLYDSENPTSISGNAKQAAAGIGNTVGTAAKEAAGAVSEVGDAVSHPSIENTGKLASTGLDIGSKVGTSFAGFLTKPILHYLQNYKDYFTHKPTLGDLAKIMVGIGPTLTA